jgi:transcriptional regulator with XRE-family HTH domain
MSEIGRQLGQRIREVRRTLSYTQEQLAERAGISVSFLSMIERAQRVPHVETLGMLANALNMSLSQIFIGVNESIDHRPAVFLPLIASIDNLRLDSSDVDTLLLVAQTLSKKKNRSVSHTGGD